MKLGKKFGVALFATSLIYSAVTPGMVFAEETEELTTGTVTVTATRSEKELLDVPMSVSVITAEEIAKQSGATVTDLLKNIPGLSDIGNTKTDIAAEGVSIRTSSGGRVLILVDGQRMVDAYNATSLPFAIDPSSIERIEIIKGPASVLYGAQAIGGVVNIITKKGGDSPLEAEVRTSYDSITDGLNSSLSAMGSMNDFSYRLAVSHALHENYKIANGEIPHSERGTDSFDAFVSYDFMENGVVGFAHNYFKEDKDYRNPIDGNNNKDFATQVVPWSNYYEEQNKTSAFAEVKFIAPWFSRLRADVYYGSNQNTKNSYDPAVYTSTGGYTNQEHTVTTNDSMGLALQADFPIADHTFIITGYDFLLSKFDSDSEDADASSMSPGLQPQTTRFNGDEFQHSVFAMAEHYLPFDITVNYGARYTLIDGGLDNYHALRHDTGKVTTYNKATADSSALVFNVGAVWSGIEDFAVRANWGQGFNPADARKKFTSSIANPELDSETSNNFEVGVRYMGDALNFDVAVFYQSVDDAIVYLPWMSGFTDWANRSKYKYENFGSTIKHGVEVEMDYLFDFGLNPYFTVAYVNSKVEDASNDYFGLPDFTGTAGIRYYTSFKEDYIRVNADLQMVAVSKIRGADADSRVPGYATFNLSAGLEWGDEHSWYVQGQINNIFDHEYNEGAGGYYQPGMNTALTLGYRF